MNIELVSLGNELLWGYTINTNAAFLSRELSGRGYTVSRHTVLADDRAEIEAGLKECLKRADLVIATGGLGPTLDDLTLSSVKNLFPFEGEDLKNRLGPAPGKCFLQGGKALFLLPGVPREMEEMFWGEVFPRIEKHFALSHKKFLARCSLCLLREKEVDPFLRGLKEKHPELEIGIFPALGTLQIVFQSKTPVASYIEKVRSQFPAFFYGEGTIQEAVHRELTERGKKLGLAESCTGGALAAALTALPGASQYLLGSIVAYSNEWKERFLQVSRTTLKKKGAVSKEAVIEMVDGLFSETEADYAIGISGIAGPSGGTAEKPVGTIYIAIGKRGEKTDAGRIQAPKNRGSTIDLGVHMALGALWRRLVHNTVTFS